MESTKLSFVFRSLAGRIALLILLSLGISAAGLAQSTATLRGTVTDASGASVPNAKVVVHNQGTAVEWTTQSDPAGNYLVPSLPPGVYQVTVSAADFRTAVVQGLTLNAATTVNQDVKLQVGPVAQTLTVTAETPVIDTSTISVGQVIDQKTVQEIPLNGRHFVDLTLLTPGTVTPPATGFLTFPLRGQGSFGLNTAGQREDTVNFMINGINLNDMVQNQITFQPSINTVSEFKIDNSTYSAQYGRNSGAIVNIATRSGTNEFHGEVFEWLRNEKLDARNFFTQAPAVKPPFKRNNFGAALGGPIVKNRVHFFASYEGVRQRQGLTINSLDLSAAQVTQAQTSGDAAIQKLVPLLPHTNATDSKGNPIFVGSATAPVNIDQGTGDVDIELATNDRLHGYLAIQQDLRQEPTLQGNTLPGWGDTRQSRRQIMTLSEDHIFGPSLTNTARLGYNRIHITFTPNQLLSSADFNINNGINAKIGLAQIDIGSFALDFGGPEGFPQGRGDTTVVFSDSMSYLRGRHSWVFGGEIRRFYNNNFSLDTTFFEFPNTTAFINDQASQFLFLGTSANKILSPAWGLFAEDSFKWLSNLTLQIGLRYDWNSTPSEARNRFVVFDTANASLDQIGTPGFGQPFHTNNKNFQPRLGLVWDPFKNGKTIVRTGYAILTDQPVTNAFTGLNSNPPFTQPLSSTQAGLSLLNAATLAGASGLAPSAVNPNFDNPYVQSWNLNVEQEITPTMGFMAGYVGSKGTHLRIGRNINQIFFTSSPGGAANRPFPIVASGTIRPGAALGNILETDSGANSIYNALWLTFNKRISHGVQLNASYTFSKSIDENSLNSQGVIVQDNNNIRGSRGLSDFDVRHRFVASGFYQLPFTGNRLVSGWQLGLITQAQSGNPLNVITAITGFTGNRTLRPDITGPVSITGNPNQWFSAPANFVVPCTNSKDPSTCHFGDLGRNALRGPDFVNTDFSIVKNTKVTERLNVQFRAEFFDVFNHANFGNPNLSVGNSRFGLISSTRFPTGDFGSSRQIQFALKLQF